MPSGWMRSPGSQNATSQATTPMESSTHPPKALAGRRAARRAPLTVPAALDSLPSEVGPWRHVRWDAFVSSASTLNGPVRGPRFGFQRRRSLPLETSTGSRPRPLLRGSTPRASTCVATLLGQADVRPTRRSTTIQAGLGLASCVLDEGHHQGVEFGRAPCQFLQVFRGAWTQIVQQGSTSWRTLLRR